MHTYVCTGAGRTIRQTRHLPGAPGPIEGFWGPQNAPMHIFCPHIYYFYKNLFTIVASGCLITHILTIFPCAPPFSPHYMDYSMLRASRSSRVCRNDVKFKTVSGKRERERNRVRHKSSEIWSDLTKAGQIKIRRKTKGRTCFQSCQSYPAFLQPPQC